MNDTKLRIAHVVEAFGGVESYLRIMLNNWDRSFEFCFVLGKDGDFADWLRARGHEVRIVPMSRSACSLLGLLSVPRLRREVSRLEPDVVHLHSSQAGWLGRVAFGRTRATVYTPHAYYYQAHTGFKRLLFLSAERVLDYYAQSWVLATSASEAMRATREVRVQESRVVSIPNGVEVPDISECYQDKAPLRVGMVARISPQKDVDTYLRAIRTTSFTCSNVFDFCLVGVGHYDSDESTLARAMTKAGLEPADLTIVPWLSQSELLTWLSSCNIVVLTSRYESFGFVIAEAGVRGIPTIGTDVDGVRDIIVDGVTGFLVPTGRDDLLVDRLRTLAASQQLRLDMSAAARGWVSREFGATRFAAEVASFYQAVAEQSLR